jgi:hypothetical protein
MQIDLQNNTATNLPSIPDRDPDSMIREYEDALKTQLDLPRITMNEYQSQFFKHHYRSNWTNLGAMVREIDVIRRQEGW